MFSRGNVGIFLYAIVTQTGTKSDKNVHQPVVASQRTSEQSYYTPPKAPPVTDKVPQGMDGAATQTESYASRFVVGSRVAFRDGPSTSEGIIDRFDSGRQVCLLNNLKIGPASETSYLNEKGG